ncbi:uncharacterized protein ARMOST_17560 [Armillaria ostoyae]|uniref:Uncharacterized protein n=1 Tax=Armillaria ostoyae TaxID=47428 RepID=A0A284RZB3_ARMOS|nr:uncharacterized protein ARMOST_17560 [Armillaria ostoyae]
MGISLPDYKSELRPVFDLYLLAILPSRSKMTTVSIAVATSEHDTWNANNRRLVLARVDAFHDQIFRALDGRPGVLAVRSLRHYPNHSHKTLKLFDANGVHLGSIHFGNARHTDEWFPRPAIDIVLQRLHLILGHTLPNNVQYYPQDHVDVSITV